jgi:hypothetical protein
MGFNKKFLPEVEDLKKMREKYADDREFLNRIFGNAEAFLGSVDSYEYLKKISDQIQSLSPQLHPCN